MNEPTSYQIMLSGSASIAIPKGDFIYTDAYLFGGVNDFALVYKVTNTGVPSVKIQMQQSIDGTNWFIPKTTGDIETALTSSAWQGCALAPICVPYVRFKITELTDLVTDTVVTMSIVLQKKYGGE